MSDLSAAAAAMGRVRSERKAKTSRANGKLGGRPTMEFRLVVGERGSVHGHIVPTKAKSFSGAQRLLDKEISAYGSDGWGRIEYRYMGQDSSMWRRENE